jgi:FAD synthase
LCSRVHAAAELALPASVVTIGAFDGVHRGHQQLIGTTVERARTLGVASVVYTFDVAPKAFFGRAEPLVTLDEKLARIARLRPDAIVVAHFDEAYARRTADQFLDELEHLNPIGIIVGGDFAFGSCKTGGVAKLRSRFDTTVVPPVRCSEGVIVSSTRIRELRRAGAGGLAARLEGWMEAFGPIEPRSYSSAGAVR